MSIKLPSSSLIELTGADAAAFAQAQFSSDVASLADGRWQWSAWLSPQGRVRAFFSLLRFAPDRILLILRGGDALGMAESLKRFVLRAKVVVRVVDDAHAVGLYDENVNIRDAINIDGDRVVIELPNSRAIAVEKMVTSDHSATEIRNWRLADIRDGFIEMSAAIEEAALPQWLGLDRLGAVSVRKGCYPGQEIMSRLHFKGGNKRSLYRIAFGGVELPPSGTALSSGGTHVANRRSATGSRGRTATPPTSRATRRISAFDHRSPTGPNP